MSLQVKHHRLSPKLAFYCLETADILPAAAAKFPEPPKTIARGHKTDEFAISFDGGHMQAFT